MIAFYLGTPTPEKRNTSWGVSKRKRPSSEQGDVNGSWVTIQYNNTIANSISPQMRKAFVLVTDYKYVQSY